MSHSKPGSTEVSELGAKMNRYYSDKFSTYGRNSQGVDWGNDEVAHQLRQLQMLKVFEFARLDKEEKSLLDVGCGYGHLADLVCDHRGEVTYTGIDVCDEMIASASKHHPDLEWIEGDFFRHEWGGRRFDYVVCNGIFTQKLDIQEDEMHRYLREFLTVAFELCRVGVAWNVMSTHVNYQAENLFYLAPSKIVEWIASELTTQFVIHHAYKDYEFTVYMYK